MSLDPYKNIVKFVIDENFITIAVLGSIITFQFLSTFKSNLVDPIVNYVFPKEKFNFMNILIKEKEKEEDNIYINFGNMFKEFISYIIMLIIIFVIAKYTKFPDIEGGNKSGAAIM